MKLLAIAALTTALTASTAFAADKVVVGYSVGATALPYYLAEELGIFKKHDLDVEGVKIPINSNLQSSLIANQIDAAAVMLAVEGMAGNGQQFHSLHLEMSTEAQTERKVRDELFDLGMSFYPQQEINIAAQPIIETEMICVMHRDHPLASKTSVDPRQLEGHSVVVVHHEGNVISRMHQLLTSKIDPNSLISTNQSIGAFNLVRQGGAVAVLHPMAVPEAALDLMALRRFEPQMPVGMALYYSRRRPLSRVAGKFMLALRDSAKVKSDLLEARGVPFKVAM